MPEVPAATLNDVTKVADRNKLTKLLYERELLGYGLSYAALLKLGVEPKELEKCVLAYTEKEAKAIKDSLNDKISAILSEYGITSLKAQDPFGRDKDCLYYPSTSVSFAQSRALEMAPKFGISTEKLAELFEAATVRKEITVVVVKDAKEEK